MITPVQVLPYDGKGGFKPRINLLIALEDTFEILFNSIYHCPSSIMCYRRFTSMVDTRKVPVRFVLITCYPSTIEKIVTCNSEVTRARLLDPCVGS